MSTRTSTRLAWTLWAVLPLVLAGSVALRLAAHRPFAVSDISQIFSFVAVATVGAVVASHQPRNPLGWIYLGIAITMVGGAGILGDYAFFARVTHPGLPGLAVAEWVTNWFWVPAFGTLLTFSLLLFPNGHLPSPRWRPVVWASAIVLPLWTIAFMFETADYTDAAGHPAPNPLAIAGLSGFFNIAKNALSIVFFALVACSVAALVARFRRGDADERHQLKWLIFAGALVFVWFALPFNHGNGGWVDAVSGIVIAMIPVSAGIAILKYRLYDIDVVISRAVVYGGLAAFITLVYVGIVVGIGTLVGTRGKTNLPLSIVATAVVAVAFQPVLARVRRIADRIAYGRRATPYEALAAFSERVGGAYAADDVLDRMAQVLRSGTAAESAVVWLHAHGDVRPAAIAPSDAISPTGMPEDAVEVRFRGELLGALSVRMPANDKLDPARERLVRDLAAQAGLALRNVSLIEDLRASRQRLVTAQDERARKLERNIHDGAQQQLVALTVKARLAQTLSERDPPKSQAMLADIQTELGEALENLRDLARGIYPPLLADKGLVAALDAQARKSPIPVAIEFNRIGRYPQEVEAAVYFCCLEALQNIAKYAEASDATVRLSDGNGTLSFKVTDDGAGFDSASTGYGTGLQGMADRLDALGGSLEVRSAAHEGTTVTGRIPSLPLVP